MCLGVVGIHTIHNSHCYGCIGGIPDDLHAMPIHYGNYIFINHELFYSIKIILRDFLTLVRMPLTTGSP